MSPVPNIKDIGRGNESGTLDQDDVPLRRTRTPSDLKWTVNELAAVKGEIEHIDREVTRLKQRRARLMRMAKPVLHHGSAKRGGEPDRKEPEKGFVSNAAIDCECGKYCTSRPPSDGAKH